MKKLITILFFSTFILAQSINIQGVLRDADGKAVSDGPYNITFVLYDAASGGSSLGWTQTHNGLQVTNGVYSALLGGDAAPLNLPFNEPYFLSISVNGTVMEPRIPLSLSPYSLAVRGVDNVFPNTGNVGIGTASPEAKLDVRGEIRTNSNVRVGTNADLILGSNRGIRNTSDDGNYILQTGWNSTLGDYTAINSGFSWDASHEPVSVVAGYHGMTVTKSSSSGTPFGVELFKVDNTGGVDIKKWKEQDLSANGYAWIGSLLIQWGTVSYNNDGAQLITFPMAFPTACFGVQVNRQASNPESPLCAVTITQSNFIINREDGIGGTQTANWMAIGN